MFITHIEHLNTKIAQNLNFPVSSLSVVGKAVSVRKTSIPKSIPSISMGEGIGWVGSSKSVGKSCLTSLPLCRGSSSSNSSKMSSLGLGNLGGVHGGNGKLWVEGRGNKRLRVEGGSNSVIDRSNGETRVSNTESCSISNILNLLELSVGVNIRVSTRNSSISISNPCLTELMLA